MYFKKLENWNESDWNRKLAPFHFLKHDQIKQILTLPTKEGVIAMKPELIEL